MSNRAARRREARALAKKAAAKNAPRITAVMTQLDGMVDQGAMGKLPPKQPGKHRWIITASYSVPESAVRGEMARQAGLSSPDFILDHETRFGLAIGCWDCEKPFPVVTPDDVCDADGYDL